MSQRKSKEPPQPQSANRPASPRHRKSPLSGRTVRRKENITRDWGLLVRDQDILDLVGTCNTHTLYPLAARFAAIHEAIKKNDIRAIDKIEKESRGAGFRKVVAAIRRGVAQGDPWSARQTARAVIAEAFHHTPAYFQALDAFSLAVVRGRRPGKVLAR